MLSFWLSRVLKNGTDKHFQKIIRQTSIRNLVGNFVAIGVILLGIFLVLAILNLDGTLNSLLAGAGIAGLAISLALQGPLSNLFSGIFIATKHDFTIGDWVETNGFAGKVVDIDLRNTKIKESDNNIVVLPNKMILDAPFKNFRLTNRIRTAFTCGVAYDSDLEQVRALAVETIETLFPPAEDEKVEFYYTEFGDSSINFMIRFWAKAQENRIALDVKSEGIIAIKKAFDAAKIEIPFPIRTIIQERNQ